MKALLGYGRDISGYVVVITLYFLLVSLPLSASAQDKFVPPCKLPYAAIAKKQRIDRVCPPEGKTTSNAHRAQNRAKNELCAAGQPVTVTHREFVNLQKRAEDLGIPFGSSNKIPQDRKVLENILTLANGRRIGEGSVVRYVAFIIHPRYSNRSKGESVNCKIPRAENNDIHLDLARLPGEPACRTVTAEVIPHYRPAPWEVDNLKLVMGRPVRITGHLFFDASHRPCANDNDKVNPKRVSNWEIHPVYAIDVCRGETLRACPASDNRKWISLDQWLNEEQQEEDEE